MIARFRSATLAVVASIAVARIAPAQTTAASAPSPPSSKITVDSVLRALHAGAAAVSFASVDAARSRVLDSLAVAFRESRAGDLTIRDFAAAATATPGYFTIFRWDRDRVERVTQPALAGALLRLQQVFAPPNGLSRRINDAMPASYALYAGAMEALNTQAIAAVQQSSTEKLRRYEVKFGEASPRLNPVETLLNYGLERVPWLPFAPNASGPSPLEFVANYATGDITPDGKFNESPVHLVSSDNVGLRFYNFGDTTRAGNPIARLLHPPFWAAGVSSFAAVDAPLRSPFGAGRRWGAFINWGSLKVAGTFGHDWRAIVGTGAQLIPHLF